MHCRVHVRVPIADVPSGGRTSSLTTKSWISIRRCSRQRYAILLGSATGEATDIPDTQSWHQVKQISPMLCWNGGNLNHLATVLFRTPFFVLFLPKSSLVDFFNRYTWPLTFNCILLEYSCLLCHFLNCFKWLQPPTLSSPNNSPIVRSALRSVLCVSEKMKFNVRHYGRMLWMRECTNPILSIHVSPVGKTSLYTHSYKISAEVCTTN